MDFLQCVKERRSIRKFKEDKVDRKLIEEIVDNAAWVPSWKNSQVTRYHVVDNKETILKVAHEMVPAHNVSIIENCTVLFIVTAIKNRSGYDRQANPVTPYDDGYEFFDAGVATQTLSLCLHEKGLGSVILGMIDVEKLTKAFNIPEDQMVVALVPAGYPAEEPVAPKRKDHTTLVTYVD